MTDTHEGQHLLPIIVWIIISIMDTDLVILTMEREHLIALSSFTETLNIDSMSGTTVEIETMWNLTLEAAAPQAIFPYQPTNPTPIRMNE
jgi:hypothetical protein